MAKYKVLKRFRDKHTKEVYAPEKEIDMNVKRAEEAEKNLGKGFLERVDAPDKKYK